MCLCISVSACLRTDRMEYFNLRSGREGKKDFEKNHGDVKLEGAVNIRKDRNNSKGT